MHNTLNSGIPAPSPPGTQYGGSPLTTAQLSPARTHIHTHTSPRGVTRFHHEYGCAGEMQINPGWLQTDRQRDERTDRLADRQSAAQQRGCRKREQRSSPG